MEDAERREHHRFKLWIPMRLELSAGARSADEVFGVIHDLSQKGALAVVASLLPVDAEASLHVEVPPASGEFWVLSARILRCTRNRLDPDGLWPYQAAIEFLNASPEIEETLRSQTAVLQGRRDVSKTVIE